MMGILAAATALLSCVAVASAQAAEVESLASLDSASFAEADGLASLDGSAPFAEADSLASFDLSIATAFGTWSGWGGNIFNNRWALGFKASSKSVGKIEQNCRITYPIGVSAVPTIQGDFAYYPTWSGLFVALNYKTCIVKWQINVTDIVYKYAPVTTYQNQFIAPVSRNSPQIDAAAGAIYFGTLTHSLLIAADVNNGNIIGKIQTHPHELAMLTHSPTLYQGKILIGTSSAEVSAAAIPSYPCCSFVGTFAAFTFNKSLKKFSVAWNMTTLPPPYGPGGWSGASVWGSQAAIDVKRNQVVVATGQNYRAPALVESCLAATNNSFSCIPDDAWLESVLAIDLPTGHINWGFRTNPLDSWTVACGTAVSPPTANCPGVPGVDADFGMGPSFVPGLKNKTPGGKDLLVIGQKNGNLYGLSADNGTRYWATATSPGGLGGGLSWGVAADLEQVYFTAINSARLNYTLLPGTTKTAKSSYGAAKLLDGSIVWMTKTPQDSMAYAPATIASDIILVARTGNLTPGPFPLPSTAKGGLVVLKKSTGAILQEIDLDAISYSGVAAHDKYLMIGTGYNRWNGTGSFYVFKIK